MGGRREISPPASLFFASCWGSRYLRSPKEVQGRGGKGRTPVWPPVGRPARSYQRPEPTTHNVRLQRPLQNSRPRGVSLAPVRASGALRRAFEAKGTLPPFRLSTIRSVRCPALQVSLPRWRPQHPPLRGIVRPFSGPPAPARPSPLRRERGGRDAQAPVLPPTIQTLLKRP